MAWKSAQLYPKPLFYGAFVGRVGCLARNQSLDDVFSDSLFAEIVNKVSHLKDFMGNKNPTICSKNRRCYGQRITIKRTEC